MILINLFKKLFTEFTRCWAIEYMVKEFVNICIFNLLSGSTYTELPNKLKNSVKGLINIKNIENKCFLWCNIKHLNPLKTYPERLTKADRNMVNDLDYGGIKFPVSEKNYSKIKQKNNICISLFCYENDFVYLFYVSNKKLENYINLLMITNENKSHCVYFKDFNRFIFNNTKCKTKNTDFESLLKGVRSSDRTNNTSYTERYQKHIPCSFAIKLCVLMVNLINQLFFKEEKMQSIDLLKQFLKKVIIAEKVIKKHFIKNLVMSAEDEQKFQSSNKSWICDKLFNVGDNKVKDHCHVTGKYRGSAHWSCNINIKLIKKVPVIFYNLRGYDSDLIMQEIGKFDVKVNFIPNGLEKYMAFKINNILNFLDNKRFVNSGLHALVKNLSDNNFKYLLQEFSSDLLELVKQKVVYPYEYMNNF